MKKQPATTDSIVIKTFDRAIEVAERDLEELRRARNALLNSSQNGACRDLVGADMTSAITILLNRAGGQASFSELRKDLEHRGAYLGNPKKPDRYTANLRTAIINNKKRFVYDRVTDMVSLRVK